jgi:hypothetical protein
LNLLPPPFLLDTKSLKIITAMWRSGNNQADVTGRVREILDHPELDFHADPESLRSDPAVGWKKTLVITFEWNNKRYVINTSEGGAVGLRVIKEYLRDTHEAGTASPTPAASQQPAGTRSPRTKVLDGDNPATFTGSWRVIVLDTGFNAERTLEPNYSVTENRLRIGTWEIKDKQLRVSLDGVGSDMFDQPAINGSMRGKNNAGWPLSLTREDAPSLRQQVIGT